METGWLIELLPQTTSVQYWAGGAAWTTNNQLAIRFARECDAVMVAECLRVQYRATEHQWG